MFDVRFVVGSAVYTGAFTPPTEKLENITNTKLLTCRLPYIGDESTTGHALTTNGAVETSPFTPYDYEPWSGDDHGGSVNFDGSDALENTVEAIGTSDFTFEGWLRVTADGPTNYQMIFDNRSALTTGPYGWYQETDDKIKMGINSTTFASDNTVAQNTWYHWALVRSSNACTFYLNGEAQTSNAGTSITTNFTGTEFNIGRNSSVGSPANGDYFIGDQADFRYSKSARYTSDFTPPTAPLAQSGSVMLMNNKSDANIYDASAANTFKVSGSVTNTSTRKFTTSSSVYFDGSNDVLTIPSSPQIILSSSDFTLEGWFYPEDITPPSGIGTIAAIHTSDNTGWYFSLYQSKWRFQGHSSLIFNSGSNATQDAWSHVAITRSGNNYTMWVNGTSSNTATSSLDWTGTVDLTIGYSHSSYYQGYIQDFRLTKGLARYTSTFTPPTAEFEL